MHFPTLVADFALGIGHDLPMRVALLILAACYAIPLFLFGWRIGPFDYNHLSTYYLLAWRYWHERGTSGLPAFNPFLCGGRTLGGDPQIPIFHPLTLLVPVVGPTWLLKLEMLAQLGLGLWGLREMLARWQVPREAQLWGALLYAGGGAVVARFLVGHVTLGFYFLYPLFIALSYRLEETRGITRQRTFVIYAALFAYCSLYKPNFLIYAIPPLLVEAAVRAISARRPATLFYFCAATTLGALVGAVSLLAPAHYFHDFPRPDDGPPTLVPLWTLLANALLPLKAIPSALYGTRFLQRHEYNLFVGPLALWFAARGVRHAPPAARSRAQALIALALFCVLFGCGRSGEGLHWWLPYSWFQAWWPGFSSVRVPVRFWYGVYLALIVWAAVGYRPAKSRIGRAVFWGVGVVPILLQAAVNLGKTATDSTLAQGSIPGHYATRIELRHAPADQPYADVRAGRAVIECPANLEIQPAPDLQTGDDLALTPSSALLDSEAHWRGWSKIDLRAQARTPGALAVTLNLHHHPYWHWLGHGRITSQPHQRLTITSSDNVLAGELVFEQPDVAAGLRLSGLALALLGALGAYAFLPRRRHRTLRIGLTGGIASGKSTAAAAFRAHGIPVIDMDRVGREITDRQPELLTRILKVFGPEVAPNGKLDRRKMREIVFADEPKRRRLEAILHPPIRAEFERECRAEEKKGARLVVCEAALLVEGGYYRHLDALVVVTAPNAIRQARLQARDNLTADLAEAIFRAQKPTTKKLKVATYAIENTGRPEELTDKVALVVEDLKQKLV